MKTTGTNGLRTLRSRASSGIKGAFNHNETYLLLVLIVLITVVSIINPRFLTGENFFAILRTYSFIGILSIGFLIVLISGGIDISFTATATVAQYLMAVVLAANPDVPIVFVILLPMIVGTLLGSMNAFLIHFLKAPSIIITIATLNAYYGILQFISKGRWIYDFPHWFRAFPKIILVRFVNDNGAYYGFSIITAIWFLFMISAAIMLRRTVLGRNIYSLGGNPEAAHRSGLNIFGLRLFAYSFMGFAAGVGAVIHAMVTQTVAPNALIGQEFDVLTAVVLGGASIFGGVGTVSGALLGVGLVAVIKNALTITRVPEYWHQVFIGGVLLISVAITATQSRLKSKRNRIINVEEK